MCVVEHAITDRIGDSSVANLIVPVLDRHPEELLLEGVENKQKAVTPSRVSPITPGRIPGYEKEPPPDDEDACLPRVA